MRLDKYLIELYPNLTRSKSQDLIKRSLVLVNNKVINKTGYEVKESDEIKVLDLLKYVSRAGLKLEHAASILNLKFNNLKVLDVGSSTGGFTDYSIQNGASIVYAYDVGTNQMDLNLRKNSKIVLNEQTNILSATITNVDIALVDVSFTSSKQILKHIYNYSNVFLVLIKPQFEVGKEHLKKGIVKDKKRVQALLDEFNILATELGFKNIKIFPTNLPGKDGNLEYWLYLEK